MEGIGASHLGLLIDLKIRVLVGNVKVMPSLWICKLNSSHIYTSGKHLMLMDIDDKWD